MMSSATTTSEVSDRSWAATRAWWTAPQASSDGMGARSGLASPVSSTSVPAPPETAAVASSRRRWIAARRPVGPSATGNVRSSGMTGHGARSVSARLSTPEGYRKNEGSVMSRAASSVSDSSGARGPMIVRRLMTRRSRSGSMGGLVTWAKRWRR